MPNLITTAAVTTALAAAAIAAAATKIMPEGHYIGCLGDIPFVVSRKAVRTPKSMKWSGSARHPIHQIHSADALTEYTGLDPDKFNFSITLMAQLGMDPMEEIKKLWKYEREGTAIPLTIGEHAYGRYRWTILSHETNMKYTDENGDIYACEVSVKLQEYLRVSVSHGTKPDETGGKSEEKKKDEAKPAAAAPEKSPIAKGSKVTVSNGAKTYTGGGLASFVYQRDFTVLELRGDRAVIGINGVVTAAMNVKDLAPA